MSLSQTNATTIEVDRLVMDRVDCGPVALSHRTSEYASQYVELIRTYDFVEGVYVDTIGSLSIYTVYQGERRAACDKIYKAYGQVIDLFPSMPIGFRLLNHKRLDTAPVPGNAYKVFPA